MNKNMNFFYNHPNLVASILIFLSFVIVWIIITNLPSINLGYGIGRFGAEIKKGFYNE